MYRFILYTLAVALLLSCDNQIAPRLIGQWQSVEIQGPDGQMRPVQFSALIDFQEGNIFKASFDCYCAENFYFLSGDRINIRYGMARCYPLVACPTPSHARLIEVTDKRLRLEWKFEGANYAKFNHQVVYKRP